VCAGTPSALSPGLELSKAGVPLHAEQAVAADDTRSSRSAPSSRLFSRRCRRLRKTLRAIRPSPPAVWSVLACQRLSSCCTAGTAESALTRPELLRSALRAPLRSSGPTFLEVRASGGRSEPPLSSLIFSTTNFAASSSAHSRQSRDNPSNAIKVAGPVPPPHAPNGDKPRGVCAGRRGPAGRQPPGTPALHRTAPDAGPGRWRSQQARGIPWCSPGPGENASERGSHRGATAGGSRRTSPQPPSRHRRAADRCGPASGRQNVAALREKRCRQSMRAQQPLRANSAAFTRLRKRGFRAPSGRNLGLCRGGAHAPPSEAPG